MSDHNHIIRDTSTPGLDVLFNSVFAITIGITLFLSFCLLRRRFIGVYSSNLFPGHKRVCNLAPVKNGLFSWMTSLINLSDSLLLPLAGFDGYSTIQSLKLTFNLLLFMSVPALLVLVPFYYSQADTSDGVKYLSFSITNIYGNAAWVPTAVCWIISLVTFYVIYVFYRNFSTLRQIYLTDPSSLMSFAHIRKITDNFGSLHDARSYFNISGRAVIIQSISANYGVKELKIILEKSGLGPIESIQQIKSSHKIEELISSREMALNSLERELNSFFNTVREESLKPNTFEWKALQGSNDDLESGRSELMDRIKKLPRLTVEERCKLMKKIVCDASFMAQHRQLIEIDKTFQDAICHFYTKLFKIGADLKNELRSFNKFCEDDLIRMEPTADDSDLDFDNDDFTDSRLTETTPENELQVTDEKISLISWKKSLKVRRNLSDLKHTLWGSSYSAIVVFKDHKVASMCRQLLLSSKLFSLQVQPVPIADDLIWSNAVMPKTDKAQREIIGTILYFTFNIFFIFISSSLSYLTDLQNLQDQFEGLKPILDGLGPKIKSIIQGILAPLAFNVAIFIAPFILLAILKMTGKISKSDLQSSLMSNYAWFLFFQTSIIGAVFSSFFEIIYIWENENLAGVLERIRNRMPTSSHFFANIIIQRAFIGLMLVLIQPAVLAKKFAFSALLPKRYKTPRLKQAFRNPNEILPGIIFPEFIVFPYQITMAFLTITPLSIIPGLLFYGVASFVFKHQFVYSYAVPNESGGLYWRKLAVHLIAGVLMNQIFAVVQFRHHKETILPTMCMILLIGFTCAYIPFLERTFGPICDNIPVITSSGVLKRKRNIVTDLRHKQTHLLQVLQPIETAPLVFARLDAEGDGNDDSYLSSERVDENSGSVDEVISIASLSNVPPPRQQVEETMISPNQAPSVIVPVYHQSSVNETRSYEVIPLTCLASQNCVTFDPFDVDNLIDREFVKMPYGHPCMLEHSQVLIVPANLPALIKVILEYPTGNFKVRSNLESREGQHEKDLSPILMGQSAFSNPSNSPAQL